ncbi:MAG: 50S ribosome-binding GTPase [Deltaproteobacteria bacterium]|nr:50S ribosome-binding GTPase [Deltaproteobacteria bacterium]MBW2070207.1 50S ribosome-binding GTPase [Deltaproteobacteria bacterium]
MPANLPPEYLEAEQRLRAARSPAEKISCLEAMLTAMPKHKGTDKLRAALRRRISKLKAAAQTKKSISKKESAFRIDKEGAGQVVLVGPPNVGKSALVAALTNANPEVADFPHTTWRPTPGMMPVANIQVQLIDTPPLTKEYVEPELLALIRRADLIVVVVDLNTDPMQHLEDVIALLREHRIAPRRYQQQCQEQHRWTFMPFLVLANKSDDETSVENEEIFRELMDEDWPLVAASAATGRNLELFKQAVVERLEIIRVYSKAPGKEADRSAPFILKKGSTVADFAAKIHKDFLEKLKCAKIWGTAVFDGQMVNRDHVLKDEDVVELHV